MDRRQSTVSPAARLNHVDKRRLRRPSRAVWQTRTRGGATADAASGESWREERVREGKCKKMVLWWRVRGEGKCNVETAEPPCQCRNGVAGAGA